MFTAFTDPMLGLPVSHAWRGYGSALFLEFGNLQPGRIRRDGSIGNPRGEMGLSLTWGWRVEGRRSVLCSFLTENLPWPKLLACLTRGTIASVAITGRLPEISVEFSTGLHIVSIRVEPLYPDWAIFDRTGAKSATSASERWLHVQHGRLHIGTPERPHD